MPPRHPYLRFLALVMFVAGLGLLTLTADLPRPEEFAATAARAGAVGPLIAVVGTGLLIVAMVPRTLLAAAAGLLFGPVAGASYVLIGATIGAAAAFSLGRWLGRDVVLLRRRVAAADAWLTARGTLGVFIVRLVPVSFGLTSYTLGTSGVRWRQYLLGTGIAMVPSTIVYASLGATALDPGTRGFAISVAAAITLSVTGAGVATVLARRQRRASAGTAAPTPPGS